MHSLDYDENVYGVPFKLPSSTTTTPWKYDAFLSYRPKDTLRNFTGHLYTALHRAGIRTFMLYHNDQQPPIGSDFVVESIKAIGESRASIIVFSKNYGSSSRCLDELARIVDCKRTVGQLVLAVYYDVSPIDVREGLEVVLMLEISRSGISMLSRTGNIICLIDILLDLVIYACMHEAKFIQKIVGHVRHKVRRAKLHVAKYPVGLDSRVEYLNSLLRIGSGDVRMVGIYGMGGIGKTTVAKAFYNMAFYLFEGSCFLANVREEAERPNGIARLQGQLICQLLGENNLKVSNEHVGISILEERFRGKEKSNYITTRDEHLLIQAKTDDRYEANRLDEVESLRLFSWHAFQRTIPLKNYMHLSDGIVSYAAGVPLALEVLGSSLMGRTMAEWKSTLEKLQLIPDKKIQGILRISFDALDDDVKNMFLDIACFFNGMDGESVMDIFKACGFFPGVGIRILIDRCLLTLSKGIILDPPKQMLISTLAFAKMHKLRLLQIENAQLSGSFEGLFKELRWLSWHHSALESLPVDFHPEKLTFLDMQNNNMNVVWHGIKFLTNLKVLDLSQSKLMTVTPDFSGTPNLEKLKFFNCTSLLKIHPSIGCLGRLTYLKMEGCRNLQSLPSSICNAVSLEILILNDCRNLEELPEDFGSLKCLRVLQVDHTAIKTLPDSIGLLCNLNELQLKFCPNLVALPKLHFGGTPIKHLPDSIGLLKNITIISGHENSRSMGTKSHFPSFRSLALPRSLNATSFLPPSVSGLRSLSKLELSCCSLSDGDIPDDLGGLFSLRVLDLRKNGFCMLPTSLGQLTSLEELFLSRCWKLKSILEFPPNLRLLIASDCRSLENIPDLSNMKFLKCLDLENCCKLVNILGLENLICVEEIFMQGCHHLSTSFACSFDTLAVSSTVIFTFQDGDPTLVPSSNAWFFYFFYFEDDSVELTLWVDYVQEGEPVKWEGPVMEYISAALNNQTNGIKWFHYGYATRAFQREAKTWVNYGPQPYPLKTGDQVEVSFEASGNLKVEKCGVHLAYKSTKATERSSLVATEIDGDIGALEISSNENRPSCNKLCNITDFSSMEFYSISSSAVDLQWKLKVDYLVANYYLE
ncbi:hypothetical protein OSB04_017734 [Centaurea solstitialis]|uniref:TIR domain-containing protein n=1 Tax=Centaurea solstitialis TaxID=347529 RepID=A0AA38T529_9ASTR|nr:hypothetical protein OSB04_017734 [Centaurea solstitialis]